MINENYKKYLKEPSLFESNYSLKIPRNPKVFLLLSKKKTNIYLEDSTWAGILIATRANSRAVSIGKSIIPRSTYLDII